MPQLTNQLDIPRCPHCHVDTPNLFRKHHIETNNFQQSKKRFWGIYVCQRCGGVVTASGASHGAEVLKMFPEAASLEEAIPQRARAYLQQALDSLHAPAGAVMLAASSVDAMLKDKGYTDGSLYARIDAAANKHLITREMAQWAHEVRLDANDQRHADTSAQLPTEHDAQRVIDFTTALAQFIFVLPAQVQRGLQDNTP